MIKTGQPLREDIKNLTITRKALVEEFIYERDIFMLVSQSGVGKSIVGTQIALSLSSGTPLFGYLKTRSAMPVYYLQLEGDYEESIERIRLMEGSGHIPINEDNLCWHEEKRIDIMTDYGEEELVKSIARTNFKPAVFIIDPVYKLVSEDICKGHAALKVVRFSDLMYQMFGCTVILIHHTTKDDYIIIDGKKVEKADAYYGHSYLKNHIRTEYYMKSQDGGRVLYRRKGRGSDTLDKLSLSYHPESMTVSLNCSRSDAQDRIKLFARQLLQSGRMNTTFREVATTVAISDSHLRRLKGEPWIHEYFSFVKDGEGKAETWQVLR